MKAVCRMLLAAGLALLTGCAGHQLVPPVNHPVTLLDSLADRVSLLRRQASQGDRKAEDALVSMLSGQGVDVLMSQR